MFMGANDCHRVGEAIKAERNTLTEPKSIATLRVWHAHKPRNLIQGQPLHHKVGGLERYAMLRYDGIKDCPRGSVL